MKQRKRPKGSKRRQAIRTRRTSAKRRSHGSSRAGTARQQAAYDRALHALALMRRGASLSSAARLEGIKPSTLLRYVGSAVRRDTPGGRYRATRSDRFTRELYVPAADGRALVAAKGIARAREYSDYANAVAHFNRTGDVSRLAHFRGKTFVDVSGRRVEFVTDPETLMVLADAGVPAEIFYRSVAPRQ